ITRVAAAVPGVPKRSTAGGARGSCALVMAHRLTDHAPRPRTVPPRGGRDGPGSRPSGLRRGCRPCSPGQLPAGRGGGQRVRSLRRLVAVVVADAAVVAVVTVVVATVVAGTAERAECRCAGLDAAAGDHVRGDERERSAGDLAVELVGNDLLVKADVGLH